MCVLIAFALWSRSGTAVFYSPDTQSYISGAQSLLDYGIFGAPGAPEIIRTPGYPIFLAAFLALGANWEWFAIIAQAVIAGLTVVITYFTARKIASERAAFWGALLLSISPLVTTYSAALLTEILCAFFISLSCFFMVSFLDGRKISFLCLSSIALTCAVFTRPAVLYAVYLVPGFVFIWGIFSKIGVKKAIGVSLLFCLFSLVPVKIWEYRNKAFTGFEGFSAIASMNFYLYNAAATLAHIEGENYYEKADAMSKKYPILNGETLNEMGIEGRAIIANNFSAYIPIHIKGMIMMFAIPGGTDLLRTFNFFPYNVGFLGKVVDNFWEAMRELFRSYAFGMIVALSAFVCLCATYVLAIFGIAKAFSSNFWASFFLLCVAVYMVLISGGPAAHSRFRVPITFIIAIFAGIGPDFAVKKFTKPESKSL